MERMLKVLGSLFGKLYVPADKQAHALGGLILFLALLPIGMLFALIVVYLAATAKEIYDSFHKDIHTSDYLDALATAFIPTVIFIVMQHPLY